MKTQNILIAHPNNSNELSIIKAFFEALKIKFEITKDSPYNTEFVEKIQRGRKEIAEGKGIRMSMTEFKKSCK